MIILLVYTEDVSSDDVEEAEGDEHSEEQFHFWKWYRLLENFK